MKQAMTGRKLGATGRIGGGVLVLAVACVFPPVAGAQITRPPRKVEVVNTPDVTVVNPESSPVPALVMNDRTVTPWHQRVQIDLPDGTRNSLKTLSVPAGQRLVAENVSTSCFVPATQRIVHVRIDHALTGVPPALFLPVADQGQVDAQRLFVGNEHTHLYFDGGTTFVLRAFRDDFIGAAGCVMTVSGYLVSMP